jgi:hypothetical protein
MINEHRAVAEMAVGMEKQNAQRKPIPVPFCPPKISHNLTQAEEERSP